MSAVQHTKRPPVLRKWKQLQQSEQLLAVNGARSSYGS